MMVFGWMNTARRNSQIMSIQEIKRAAIEFLNIIRNSNLQPHGERDIAFPFCNHLDEQFGNIKRELSVQKGRIDIRIGGTNPIVMELAVKPQKGGRQLYGPQNSPELRKLCRIPQARARLRILLLMDLYETPYDRSQLQTTYNGINAGPGRFERISVRIIYVHKDHQFDFLWSPYR